MWEIYCNFVIQSEDDSHDNTDHNSLDSQLYIPSETKPLGSAGCIRRSLLAAKEIHGAWHDTPFIACYCRGDFDLAAGICVGEVFPDTERGRLKISFQKLPVSLFFCGTGRNRTAVQTSSKKVFYTLSFSFRFRARAGEKLSNHRPYPPLYCYRPKANLHQD